ncbi:ribonuclease P protein component [Kordiimonas sp.]|uniref:ribonuclease P protein component n=1 Tax=Kordiimonas sp. TaxID=1970157 RepID=UPI003A8DF9C7
MSTTIELERVTKRPEYLAIAGTRRKWVTPSFIVQALPAKTTPAPESENSVEAVPLPRIGFTVSKKVGNAVKRNRARRRLKEAARIAFSKYASVGWAYVVVGRPAAVSYDFEKMQADMRWALAKLASGADLKPSRSVKNKAASGEKTVNRGNA